MQFKTRRRIEFADTDMGGIVHFSRFFVFMETAEHEFLASLGTSAATIEDDATIGWPRVAAACEYRRPARFGDVLEILLQVRRLGRTSLTYDFRFTRDAEELATGSITAVCCELIAGQPPRPIPLPRSLAEQLGAGRKPAE